MAEASRRLRGQDLLYRAVTPDQYDEQGPLMTAFEDTGGHAWQPSETLSFSASPEARPSDCLRAISRRRAVRDRCGTEDPPSPQIMYANGYRVAALSAQHVLTACERPGTPLSILTDKHGNQVEPGGHVQVHNGHRLADTWARLSRILSAAETFPD